MKNQRGVTLVEVLVIIVIMGMVFVPISMMVIYSLETKKEVSTKNEIQREARFIMEYVTEKMRDSNVEWRDYSPELKKLEDSSTSPPNALVEYQESGGDKGVIKIDNVVISENIMDFIVIDKGDLITVKLTIEKSGFEFELQSEIIHPDSPRYLK